VAGEEVESEDIRRSLGRSQTSERLHGWRPTVRIMLVGKDHGGGDARPQSCCFDVAFGT